jgi:hypothetical protein
VAAAIAAEKITKKRAMNEGENIYRKIFIISIAYPWHVSDLRKSSELRKSSGALLAV